MPNAKMGSGRIEAFSDGVIAIIVTIMVLQLTNPSQPTFPALLKQAPIFLSYALSFLVVAIMWVNHHHLIHAVREVNAPLLWSNINLLFWMSLTPFVTDFMGRNPRLTDGQKLAAKLGYAPLPPDLVEAELKQTE
jgi:uncharacterized membrane protein